MFRHSTAGALLANLNFDNDNSHIDNSEPSHSLNENDHDHSETVNTVATIDPQSQAQGQNVNINNGGSGPGPITGFQFSSVGKLLEAENFVNNLNHAGVAAASKDQQSQQQKTQTVVQQQNLSPSHHAQEMLFANRVHSISQRAKMNLRKSREFQKKMNESNGITSSEDQTIIIESDGIGTEDQYHTSHSLSLLTGKQRKEPINSQSSQIKKNDAKTLVNPALNPNSPKQISTRGAFSGQQWVKNKNIRISSSLSSQSPAAGPPGVTVTTEQQFGGTAASISTGQARTVQIQEATADSRPSSQILAMNDGVILVPVTDAPESDVVVRQAYTTNSQNLRITRESDSGYQQDSMNSSADLDQDQQQLIHIDKYGFEVTHPTSTDNCRSIKLSSLTNKSIITNMHAPKFKKTLTFNSQFDQSSIDPLRQTGITEQASWDPSRQTESAPVKHYSQQQQYGTSQSMDSLSLRRSQILAEVYESDDQAAAYANEFQQDNTVPGTVSSSSSNIYSGTESAESSEITETSNLENSNLGSQTQSNSLSQSKQSYQQEPSTDTITNQSDQGQLESEYKNKNNSSYSQSQSVPLQKSVTGRRFNSSTVNESISSQNDGLASLVAQSQNLNVNDNQQLQDIVNGTVGSAQVTKKFDGSNSQSTNIKTVPMSNILGQPIKSLTMNTNMNIRLSPLTQAKGPGSQQTLNLNQKNKSQSTIHKEVHRLKTMTSKTHCHGEPFPQDNLAMLMPAHRAEVTSWQKATKKAQKQLDIDVSESDSESGSDVNDKSNKNGEEEEEEEDEESDSDEEESVENKGSKKGKIKSGLYPIQESEENTNQSQQNNSDLDSLNVTTQQSKSNISEKGDSQNVADTNVAQSQSEEDYKEYIAKERMSQLNPKSLETTWSWETEGKQQAEFQGSIFPYVLNQNDRRKQEQNLIQSGDASQSGGGQGEVQKKQSQQQNLYSETEESSSKVTTNGNAFNQDSQSEAANIKNDNEGDGDGDSKAQQQLHSIDLPGSEKVTSNNRQQQQQISSPFGTPRNQIQAQQNQGQSQQHYHTSPSNRPPLNLNSEFSPGTFNTLNSASLQDYSRAELKDLEKQVQNLLAEKDSSKDAQDDENNHYQDKISDSNDSDINSDDHYHNNNITKYQPAFQAERFDRKYNVPQQYSQALAGGASPIDETKNIDSNTAGNASKINATTPHISSTLATDTVVKTSTILLQEALYNKSDDEKKHVLSLLLGTLRMNQNR